MPGLIRVEGGQLQVGRVLGQDDAHVRGGERQGTAADGEGRHVLVRRHDAAVVPAAVVGVGERVQGLVDVVEEEALAVGGPQRRRREPRLRVHLRQVGHRGRVDPAEGAVVGVALVARDGYRVGVVQVEYVCLFFFNCELRLRPWGKGGSCLVFLTKEKGGWGCLFT